MAVLPPSFLGKKVFLNGEDKRYYILKYEEPSGNRKIHALLFDREAPVIFAVLDYKGSFLDSFYLSNKTTADSAKAMEQYRKIADRKSQHKVTQDDLKDALRSENEARMKNENIMKLLVDEHLEDIKHQWPSRLIALQNADGNSDNSLILTALEEALEKANPAKAFTYLLQHRLDSRIPLLAGQIQSYPDLIEDVSAYYLSFEQAKIMEQFLTRAASYIDIEDASQTEKLLKEAQKIDHVHYSSVMRHVLSKLLKRVKAESDLSVKEWLTDSIHTPSLKRDIIQLLKKKTG